MFFAAHFFYLPSMCVFLMIGMLLSSTQLPAFSLKARAKDRSSVTVRSCVTDRKEIRRKPILVSYLLFLLQPERCY